MQKWPRWWRVGRRWCFLWSDRVKVCGRVWNELILHYHTHTHIHTHMHHSLGLMINVNLSFKYCLRTNLPRRDLVEREQLQANVFTIFTLLLLQLRPITMPMPGFPADMDFILGFVYTSVSDSKRAHTYSNFPLVCAFMFHHTCFLASFSRSLCFRSHIDVVIHCGTVPDVCLWLNGCCVGKGCPTALCMVSITL